ncbi:MAG: hypothetical protein CL434_09575 [Acidimicrobiaceae bacterium]|jgi:hypothetical protein|nr:hypothetical protein [Acidimicrobiaceae bacterium]|tara:strand:- start:534 stop:1340 length:807 start_codon:yes stop_codon:yes gene_type:complete
MELRLRQVAIIGNEYEQTEAALSATFGLQVAYRDPGNRPAREAGVSIFGLKNFVMPIGNQFLELVVPLKEGPGTAGGRYLQRRGGPGGYMLLFQVPRSEYELHHRHLTELGVRVVAAGVISEEGSEAMHIHPKDLPGCLVELRWCANEDVPDGDWWPVERDWRNQRNTDFIEAICGAEIQTRDPLGLAERWANVLQVSVAMSDGSPTIPTIDGPIRFTEPSDERPEGLGAIDVRVSEPELVLTRAASFGLDCRDQTIEVSGLRLHLVK